MENDVVFTGLPRMPARFRRSVSEMVELADQGLVDRIIFVTWKGQLENKSDLRGFLVESGVELVEVEESPIGGHGNIWHQMKALDIGLQEIPSGHNVLKTRSDVYIEQEFLRRMFSGEIDELQAPSGSDVFSKRLWAPFFAIDKPFFICDFCFYGPHQDIVKLYNYDARYEVLYGLGTRLPEKRRFIHPYIDEFPFLKTYYSTFLEFGWGRNHYYEDRHQFLEQRFHGLVFCALLSFFYKIMMEDYHVNYEPVTFRENSQYTSYKSLDTEEYMTNFTRGPARTEYNLLCKRPEWLSANFCGTPNKDVPDQILTGIRRDFAKWRDFEIDETELRRELEQQRRYHDTTDYPTSPTAELVSQRILEPLNLKTPALKAYRWLAN